MNMILHDVRQSECSRVRVWGLPLDSLTLVQTVDEVDRLIALQTPKLLITANLHYAMLSAASQQVRAVNENAALVLADGMPLVWASRWKTRRLPERVAGSDLLPALCERASERGHRVFLLGGGPGVGEEAARRLTARYPRLQIAGIVAPPFRPLTNNEEMRLIAEIRDSQADILFAALGQPRGELWLAEHAQALGVPISIQVGASLDFAAGRIPRAPRWIQRLGVEWVYRLYREPRRLLTRYLRNLSFLGHMVASDLSRLVRQGTCREEEAPPARHGS